MAFFKFRRGGDDQAAAAQPESVEMMRRRAKHRLIGAVVLVLLGVVGFPLLFDTQPRPIPVDIPIEIPDKGTSKPLAIPAPSPDKPAAAPAPAPVAVPTPAPAPAPQVTASASLDNKEEIVAPAKAPAGSAPAQDKPAPAAVAAKPAKPASKPEPATRPDDGAKAKALLEGRPVAEVPDKPASDAAAGRFVVQVGAFADVAKARETRLKVEKAGLKTYTQVVETKDGKRIRVRVGPYASKAEADKAASKIKGLDLPAAVLTL